jgi:lipoyl(octanoyl) transferase
MEEALIGLCGEFGVAAGRICGLTGVWCGLPPSPEDGSLLDESCATTAKDAPGGERKIAAIGIHVARGVTSHGFAFNVTTDLRDFALINPCGITDRPVTSLANEVRDPAALPGLEALAPRAAWQFGAVFDEPVESLESLAALRAQAARPAEAEFPAQDTPLEVPPEIERLRQLPRPVKDRSILA